MPSRFATVIVVSVALAGLSALGRAPRTTPSGCTTIVWPWVRDPEATRILLVGTRDSLLIDSSLRAPSVPSGRRFMEPDTIDFYGRLAVVVRLAGPDKQALETAFRHQGDRRILVLRYDQLGDCSWTPSTDTAPFPRPGETTFVAVRFGPPATWVNKIPTFRTSGITGLLNPLRARYWMDTAGVPIRSPVSAAQYFDIYPVLPTLAAWERSPSTEAARLRAWAQANPDAAGRLPMIEALWFMEREIRERAQQTEH